MMDVDMGTKTVAFFFGGIGGFAGTVVLDRLVSWVLPGSKNQQARKREKVSSRAARLRHPGALDPVKTFQNVSNGQAKKHRSSMRTGSRRRRQQESIYQPSHLFRCQRCVDFDCSMTGQ